MWSSGLIPVSLQCYQHGEETIFGTYIKQDHSASLRPCRSGDFVCVKTVVTQGKLKNKCNSCPSVKPTVLLGKNQVAVRDCIARTVNTLIDLCIPSVGHTLTCYCDSDGCNGSSHVVVNSLLFLVSGIGALSSTVLLSLRELW